MVGSFHFSLEHVLQYRQRLEDQARQELAVAQNAYQAQIHLLESMRRKYQEAENELKSQNCLSSEKIWLWSTYRERLLHDIQRNEVQLQRFAAEVAACRAALIQKSKDVKVLERLKTRQVIEYHEQKKRDEQKELDEISSIRHQHKSF